jgi:hypothetical protein
MDIAYRVLYLYVLKIIPHKGIIVELKIEISKSNSCPQYTDKVHAILNPALSIFRRCKQNVDYGNNVHNSVVLKSLISLHFRALVG